MEVLSTTTYGNEISYWIPLIIAIVCLMLAIFAHINDSDTLPFFIVLSFTLAFTTVILYQEKDIVTVEVKATIYDWNEVYKLGYEVADQEGKIVTLKKKVNKQKRIFTTRENEQ